MKVHPCINYEFIYHIACRPFLVTLKDIVYSTLGKIMGILTKNTNFHKNADSSQKFPMIFPNIIEHDQKKEYAISVDTYLFIFSINFYLL